MRTTKSRRGYLGSGNGSNEWWKNDDSSEDQRNPKRSKDWKTPLTLNCKEKEIDEEKM